MKRISLAGSWIVAFDPDMKAKDFPETIKDIKIELPDTVNHARLVKRKSEIRTDCLCDEYAYEGNAWFKKDIYIPEDIENCDISFYIERTRITTVFFDGESCGTEESLCTPHVHRLPDTIKKGNHQLVVLVNNTEYKTRGGHMTSQDTQTNWLGLLGKLEIQIRKKNEIRNLKVATKKIDGQSAFICISAQATALEEYEINIFKRGSFVSVVKKSVTADEKGNLQFETELTESDIFWDEYNPRLLEVSVTSPDGDKENTVFGIRQFSTDASKLLINGRQLFLRGKHDGMVFPETGYAPMDVHSWKNVFYIAGKYGINHYRFHTACPPEAAFVAADEMGIFLEPELPFWGTFRDEDDPECDKAEQEFLIEEGRRILDTFGNHPSFFMLSLGNELWGSKKRIAQVLNQYKEYDDRCLYTAGSNNFQFYPSKQDGEDVLVTVRFSRDRLIRGSYATCDAPLGFVQTDRPRSDVDYDSAIFPDISEGQGNGGKQTIKIQYGTGVKEVDASESQEIIKPDLPVISHEVGQYYFYPDFDSERKYISNIKPTYLKSYRENLERSGIFDRHKKYFRSAGKLAVACYKLDIEGLMKTNSLSGFQLLDLQDFPGQDIALVGILDAFMESKKLVNQREWGAFLADNVVMASIPGFVYSASEELPVQPVIATGLWEKANNALVRTLLLDDEGNVYREKQQFTKEISGRVTRLPAFKLSLDFVTKPKKLSIKMMADIEVDGQVKMVQNAYDIWIFPEVDVEITDEYIRYDNQTVKICKNIDEALTIKSEGAYPLVIPEKRQEDIDGIYASDFWNYSMFSKISRSMGKPEPIGTLGLYIDDTHPFFMNFITENYSTPVWYNLVMNSHSRDLTGVEELVKIAEPIDNPVRAKSLGLLYEEKGVLCCTARLYDIKDYPEVKAFAMDIIRYLYTGTC